MIGHEDLSVVLRNIFKARDLYLNTVESAQGSGPKAGNAMRKISAWVKESYQ